MQVFDFNGSSLSSKQSLAQPSAVNFVKYSPDGKYLSSSDGNRNIYMYEMPSYNASDVFPINITILYFYLFSSVIYCEIVLVLGDCQYSLDSAHGARELHRLVA